MCKDDDQKGDCLFQSQTSFYGQLFCIAQFPLDGKLDGKSMKHKAEHLKHNNKIQTMADLGTEEVGFPF